MKWTTILLICFLSVYAIFTIRRPSRIKPAQHNLKDEIPFKTKPQSPPLPSQSQPSISSAATVTTTLQPVATIPSPAPASPTKEEHLPRGPDDLTDGDFVKKYRDSNFADWLKQKPPRRFPASEWGNIFVINMALVLALEGGGELQYRSSIANEPDDLAEPTSCVSIRSADKTTMVGEFADGTLHIRHGPIPNSYLLSISEKHYFLSYNDRVGDQEIRNHYDHPTPVSPFGVLLYYLKGDDGQIRYQGHAVRWDEDPTGKLRNPDYCRSTF